MGKITRATFKSFVKKNASNLKIKVKSSFDGMIDGTSYNSNPVWVDAAPADRVSDHNLGINGVWLVGQSRDYFAEYNDATMTGIEVSNSCGNFVVAVAKAGV